MLLATLALFASLLGFQAASQPGSEDARWLEDPGLGWGGLPQVSGVRLTTVQNGSRAFYVHIVTISTGTGFPESFVLHAPTQPPASPAPLVTIFHQFGKSHTDVLLETEFIQAAFDRGWYLVCPLGGSKKHMSSIPSQLNTEIVLNWMLGQPAFNIDTDRLYAIGFSMGGGAAMNYVARHKDMAGPRFAAVVNHTGTASNINAYADDCLMFACASQFVWDFWFGDGSTGSAMPWEMARSSVFDYDASTLQVDDDRALARNLMDGTAIQLVRGDTDTQVPYLIEQTDVLDTYLQSKGAVPGMGYDYFVHPYASHDWGLLDEGQVLDWLAPFTLQSPTTGDTLADRDGAYYYFDVVQSANGAFTPFRWTVNALINSVLVVETKNLASITVDTAAAGLDTSADLIVGMGTRDGNGDSLRLTGYAAPPTGVLRDGVVETSWVHDAQLGTLELIEVDGAAHSWLVQP